MKLPILLVLLLAAGFGYLLGTEHGRQQRDQILVKIRGGGDDLADAADAAADTVADAADSAADAVASG